MTVSLLSSSQFFIAKTLWEPCVLCIEAELALHRERTEKKMQQLNLPPRLQSAVQRGLILVEQAYDDCSHWFYLHKKERVSVLHTREFFTNDVQYRYSAFMTAVGEFSDVRWVKLFVNDQQQPILDRFNFACFYCFVEDIRLLWQQIMINGWPADYCNKNYSNIRLSAPSLVSFWIHYLDGKQVQLVGTGSDSFFYYGLQRAIDAGHARAVHYFWRNLSEQERVSALDNIDGYAELVCRAAEKRHTKIIHFLYSQLTVEKQSRVLLYDTRNNLNSSVWCDCFLQPRFIRLFPEQIVTHQNTLPPTAYSNILFNFACKIYYLSREGIKNSIYQDIFQEVWHLGSSNNKSHLLLNKMHVLKLLLVAKQYNCAKCLLKDCSLDHKRRFLFGRFGRFIFEQLVCEQDWAGLENNFMLFLMDLNRAQSTLALFHNDSLGLLTEFQEKSWFYKWITNTDAERAAPLAIVMNNLSRKIHVDNLLKYLIMKAEKMSSLY